MEEISDDLKWSVESSDEEFEGTQGDIEWEPTVEEMKRMFQILETSKVCPLNWKCLGRRLPSPPKNEYPQDDDLDIDDDPNPEEQSDFDFKDELISPLARRRPTSECRGQLKGSAKKKTTSLDGILNNMRRHRQLEQLEKESEQTTTSAYHEKQ